MFDIETRNINEAINGNSQLKYPSKKDKKYYRFKKNYQKYGFSKAYDKTRIFISIKSKLKKIKFIEELYNKLKRSK